MRRKRLKPWAEIEKNGSRVELIIAGYAIALNRASGIRFFIE
jgi:hypothetical protein